MSITRISSTGCIGHAVDTICRKCRVGEETAEHMVHGCLRIHNPPHEPTPPDTLVKDLQKVQRIWEKRNSIPDLPDLTQPILLVHSLYPQTASWRHHPLHPMHHHRLPHPNICNTQPPTSVLISPIPITRTSAAYLLNNSNNNHQQQSLMAFTTHDHLSLTHDYTLLVITK